ncbi:MAG: phosphopantothenoylcysteine decarboxylase [Endomicrobia bacterium]|nr:phosphopantothenoylcysteine decarboxylase [Endomicrobiia bacterium]MCL2798737.1 phosphopantothenoylcysteine decarboxylase [Endomicrobiia bacterium]
MPLTFLITSGPTKEYIDPVRYICNDSSGKMGAALACRALKKNHKVIFITGSSEASLPRAAKIIKVTSALDMFKSVKDNFKKADIIIGAAAVADFRPVLRSRHKIKKGTKSPRLLIKLQKNPDIIAYCGKNKKKQVVAGFALETQNLILNAEKKLKNKNLDLIIANNKQSLGSDKTTVHLITANSVIARKKTKFSDEAIQAFAVKSLKQASKNIIAGKIIDETIRIFERIKAGKKNS